MKSEPLLNRLDRHLLPSRLPLPNHFTASAVVIVSGHVLMVHHRRIGAWLPPGGHIDGGELPHEAAEREVFEETGIEVEVISEVLPASTDEKAFVLPSPLCLHAVHAIEKGEELYHIDVAYLCRLKCPADKPENHLPAIVSSDEVHQARWIDLQELDSIALARNVPEVLALALTKLGASSPQI